MFGYEIVELIKGEINYMNNVLSNLRKILAIK